MPLSVHALKTIHDIGIICIVLCIISIASLTFVIVYHIRKQYQKESLSSYFVMFLCYSDIMWEILLILNIASITDDLDSIYFIDYLLMILSFVAAALCTGIPALLAFCTYLSLILSEDWLLKRKRRILYFSGLIMILNGIMYKSKQLSGGFFFVCLVATYSKYFALIIVSILYLMVQPLLTISLALYSYAKIYMIFRNQCISKESRYEIYRLFLYPLIMMYVQIWVLYHNNQPLISLIISYFDDFSQANLIVQSISFVSLSLAGFFDSVAYGLNAIRIMESDSTIYSKLMEQTFILESHTGTVECSNLKGSDK